MTSVTMIALKALTKIMERLSLKIILVLMMTVISLQAALVNGHLIMLMICSLIINFSLESY